MSVPMGFQMPDYREMIDDWLGQVEGVDLDESTLDALLQLVTMAGIQSQFAQSQASIAQSQLGLAQTDLGFAELDYKMEHEIPFRIWELDQKRLLGELNLQEQRELFDFKRRQYEQEMAMLKERGSQQTLLDELAVEQARLRLAEQREQYAHEAGLTGSRRGAGQFTPRGVF